MTSIRIWMTAAVLAIAAIAATTGSAEAQERYMLVLVDASGSMTTVRADPTYPTRWDAAKALSDQRIVEAATTGGLDGVAVWTFKGSSATAHTAGFVDVNTARAAVMGLSGPSGATPLAGSLCDAIDELVKLDDPNDTRILHLASDGLENATPALHACYGPDSVIDFAPYSAGSWQNKVYDKATNPGGTLPSIVQIDLFDYTQVTGFAAARAMAKAAVEAKESSKARGREPGKKPPTIYQLFTAITEATGGKFTIIGDDQRLLPPFGDVTGDLCVDYDDAYDIAWHFNETLPGPGGKYDLDYDRIITYADYELAAKQISGKCGNGDRYKRIEPLTCKAGDTLKLENVAIQTPELAIRAEKDCTLVITDSHIVSGLLTFQVEGEVKMEVYNSKIAGAGLLYYVKGLAYVFGKESFFKGLIEGDVKREGNTWKD
jgi:hypothetical protein